MARRASRRRRSRAARDPASPRSGRAAAALEKSVPRGSVIVGMRTRRSPSVVAASLSSHCTPASPRLSVSAMMCACVTGTKSRAPKNSPTLIWCCSACCGTGPALPASMACSSSFSFIAVIRPSTPAVAHRLAPFGDLARWNSRERAAVRSVGTRTPSGLELAAEGVARDDALDSRRSEARQRIAAIWPARTRPTMPWSRSPR